MTAKKKQQEYADIDKKKMTGHSTFASGRSLVSKTTTVIIIVPDALFTNIVDIHDFAQQNITWGI